MAARTDARMRVAHSSIAITMDDLTVAPMVDLMAAMTDRTTVATADGMMAATTVGMKVVPSSTATAMDVRTRPAKHDPARAVRSAA